MENACYYTFSTVCQMLAGAFGFLVAVVLYRLQRDDQRLHDKVQRAAAGWEVTQESAEAFAQSRAERDWSIYAELLRGATYDTKLAPHTKAKAEVRREQWLAIADGRKSIAGRLTRALTATGLSVGVSLVMLPLTPFFADNRPVAYGLMCVVAAMALNGLSLCFELARDAAK